MRFNKIYANRQFKEVVFNPGLNVILGRVLTPLDHTRHAHNLGKSLLLQLLEFMLVKKEDKNFFLRKHEEIFSDYVFYLEITTNGGRYLTIKRSANKMSRVSFRYHADKNQNFVQESNWEYEDLPFSKAQDFLNEALGFNVLDDYSYRNTVSYFLRMQNDYNDVFQLQKYVKGKDIDWKPMMLSLLGYNAKDVIKKYELDDNIELQKQLIHNYEHQHSIQSGEKDRVFGMIEMMNAKRNKLQQQVDQFDFQLREQNISKQVAEDLEERIAELNTLHYDTSYEIERIKESLVNSITVNIDETKKLYEEAEIYFPDQLIKKYQELIEFNQMLFTERKVHLSERLKVISFQKTEIENELQEANNKRSELLKLMVEKDSFKKFKAYQRDLGSVDEEIRGLEEKLRGIDNSERLRGELENTQKDLEETTKSVRSLINSSSDDYSKIRKNFSSIIDTVINRSALISKKINSNNNIEFAYEIQNNAKQTITSEGEGHTYKKILCAAFDLALLMCYSDRSFFRFCYHDGVFESLDDRPKKNYLTMVREICRKYSIQYILTAIDDELPRTPDGVKIPFEKGEVVLELSDKGDEGKLFGVSF